MASRVVEFLSRGARVGLDRLDEPTRGSGSRWTPGSLAVAQLELDELTALSLANHAIGGLVPSGG